MTSRYNIALLPRTQSDFFISLAKNFSEIADAYILGENSFPHITIYQFDAADDQVKKMWESVLKLNIKGLKFTLAEFSCITFDNVTFWTSLLPIETAILKDLHEQVSKEINMPIKVNYDPHLTLMNTKNSSYMDLAATVQKEFSPISDQFVLSLGKSDSVGQFTDIISRDE